MTTYNTATQSVGAEKVFDNAPAPEASARDKSAGTIELRSDGTSRLTLHRKSSTVDVRATEKAEIAASSQGPSSEPIRLRSRSGAGLSSAQAEVDTSRALISILGRETSLKAAIAAGWVTRGADGNYYDSRAGAPQPGKADTEGGQDTLSEDDQQQQQDDTPEDHEGQKLPKGFELSEEQQETMAGLKAMAEDNPTAIDYAFSHAAHNGDMSDRGFVETLAAETGLDAGELEATIVKAQTAYTMAADAAVAEVSNVEPQVVYDWLRQSQPGMAAQVVMEAQTGNFGAVKEATSRYIQNLDSIDPEAALGADLGPHAKAELRNGKVNVRLNGRLMSWREAMRHREK